MEYKIARITLPKRPKIKSQIVITNCFVINSDSIYNKFQKKMWKWFFNIDIEDVEGNNEIF